VWNSTKLVTHLVTQLQTLAAQCFQGKEQNEHLKLLIGKRDVMGHSK